MSPILRIFALLLCCCVLAAAAWGEPAQERVSVGADLVIERGELASDVVCVNCSIRVEGEATGDVVAIGGRITVPGRVRGDVVAVGGSVDLGGTVGGDVVAVAGGVNLSPGAAIGGEAVAVLGGVKGVRDGRIGGKVTSVDSIVPIVASGLAVVLVMCLITALIVQPLLTLLASAILGPNRLAVLADTAASRGLLSFFLGAGLLFASFLLSFVSIFIPLWIPGLQFPFGAILFVVLVVGYAGVSYWVGRGLAPRANAVLAAFLGAIFVTIVQLIPIVGWIAGFIFFMMALGTPVVSGFGTAVDWMGGRPNTPPKPV